ncbi:hypothetical protein GCM10010915_11830 [Microbacterium faecale]|uniref:Uncharacterized protein n=1 Tax=Microbacterium faecale TaxID=1804630 RepID=A0A916Y669_9MICO|nr:hypothetical protein [Microbacterium faecale]GGD33087.1 hypothetical protein GCM10010915_11830 [Microbacterium faecale]
MVADRTIYDDTKPSVGSLALAHQKLLYVEQDTAFENVTGDINNLNTNPTPITVQREVYGTKGRTSQDIIGYNFAPTFDVEVIRDPETGQIVAAQAWLIDLMDAAYSEGEANKRNFRIVEDALDERMPAFEGKFSVAVAPANTGYADKNVLTFTLANDGVVERMPISPIDETFTEDTTGGGE